MTKIYLSAVLLVASLTAFTQQPGDFKQTQLFPNGEELIQLQKGDSFVIRVFGTHSSKRPVLATVLRASGAALTAYNIKRAIRMADAKNQPGISTAKSTALSALGLGVFVSAGQLSKIGKHAGNYLSYEIYDQGGKLAASGFVHVKKNNDELLAGRSPVTGRIKIIYTDARNNTIGEIPVSVDIAAAPEEPAEKLATETTRPHEILQPVTLEKVGSPALALRPVPTASRSVRVVPATFRPLNPSKEYNAGLKRTAVKTALATTRPVVRQITFSPQNGLALKLAAPGSGDGDKPRGGPGFLFDIMNPPDPIGGNMKETECGDDDDTDDSDDLDEPDDSDDSETIDDSEDDSSGDDEAEEDDTTDDTDDGEDVSDEAQDSEFTSVYWFYNATLDVEDGVVMGIFDWSVTPRPSAWNVPNPDGSYTHMTAAAVDVYCNIISGLGTPCVTLEWDYIKVITETYFDANGNPTGVGPGEEEAVTHTATKCA